MVFSLYLTKDIVSHYSTRNHLKESLFMDIYQFYIYLDSLAHMFQFGISFVCLETLKNILLTMCG